MSKKILVLENTEGISELLTISLSNDYDVLMAANGEEALKLIRSSNPPIVVFDIRVPDMDGIEFLCKIKKQSPQTEVITIADADNLEKGVTSLKYDASDFIVKPVTSMALELALERAEKKLAIRKRLSPTSGDVFPSIVDTERLSMAKQVMRALAPDDRSASSLAEGLISGIMALHTRNGAIASTTAEHKKLFGNMEGKKSWEVFKRGSIAPEACPVALAFKTGNAQTLDVIVSSRTGDEMKARSTATPLVNHHDQTDLVLEIITL
jgi:YesN/AraC family two-component response regulator